MFKRQRVEAPKPVTVLDLWRKAQQKKFAADTASANSTMVAAHMTAGFPCVPLLPCVQHHADEQEDDEWLQLRTGVFELAGEAGAGKTQLALSLCQRTALSAGNNHDGNSLSSVGPTALYLSLGAGRLPKALQRLQQMAACCSRRPGEKPSWLLKILTKPLLQRDDWSDFLREADAFFTRHQGTLRLVVVDSLADLVRDDFVGRLQLFDRTTWLLAAVQRAKVLAERYQLAWLFINQQTTTVSATTGMFQSKPALGLAWAHAVQGSWICHKSSGGMKGGQRRLVLHKSNRHAVGHTAWFVIQQSGVQRVVASKTNEGNNASAVSVATATARNGM